MGTTTLRRPRPGALGGGLVLALGALGILGIGGVVLAWDGSWVVARTAITGTPTFLHGRAIGWLTQAPMLAAVRLSDDPWLATTALGLATAAVFGFALVASWWVVRPDSTWLLVFPMLGIGLGLLPGQVDLISEALMVAALAWPLVLAAALGRIGRHRWLITAIVAMLALAHPFAVPVLVLAAGVAWVASGRGAAVVLLAVAGIVAVRYLVLASPYESEALSPDRLLSQFRGSVIGPPLVAIGASVGLALWIGLRPRDDRLARLVVVVALLVVAVAMVRWASDLGAWDQALMYRTFGLAVQLPTMAVAVVVARRASSGGSIAPVVVPGVAAVMVVVYATQVWTWQAGLERLRDDLAGRPSGCLHVRDVVERPSPLDHWGTTALVVILEAPTPRHLVIEGPTCERLALDEGVPLKAVAGVVVDHAPVDGWFDLRALAGSLEATGG